MNDLKFKVYVKPKNTKQNYSGLYDVQAINFLSKQVMVIRASVFEENIFNFSDVELLQYSKYTDQENNALYDKDLVTQYIEDKESDLTFLQLVEFKDGAFYVNDELLSLCHSFIKRIGSIYEYPQLKDRIYCGFETQEQFNSWLKG